MKGTATAKLNNLRMGPRKVRLVVDLIRGRKVADALTQLQFMKKHAARPVMKLIQSAIANAAHNHQLEEDTLVITEAYVDGGPMLHRWMPRAMGRATPIRKRTSHITLVIAGDVNTAAKVRKEEKAVEAEATDAVAEAPKKKTAPKKAAAKKPAATKKKTA